MAKTQKECLVCKNTFSVYPYRKDSAKYCSHKCYSKTVHMQKRTKKWYESMKKRNPWNKGKEWSKAMKKKLSSSQKRRFKTELIHRWQGTRKEYLKLHEWIRGNKNGISCCVVCGEKEKRIHWANISGNYHKELKDYIELCPLHHNIYDRGKLPINLFEWEGKIYA